MAEIHTLKHVEQKRIHILSVRMCTINWEGDMYDGEYEVIPKTYDQVLPTKHKTMAGDVTVREIPYYETSNPQGGVTVYIGE